MTRTRFHVIPQDGQWLIVKIGELFKGPYLNKDEAVGAAHLMALLRGPAHVLVHDLTGGVQSETLYGHAADRPDG